ncbi:MAG: hypothetical protein QNJ16_20030 [Rhodobacter sp.]|nr:hypothetical protein [Rhodobacter sp.]
MSRSMKLGVTEDDQAASWRAYNQSNREVWKTLGYRMVTSMVHDADREVILSELEVRKYQRMVMIAEDLKTSDEELYTIATRNAAKTPPLGDRKDTMEGARNSKQKQQIKHFVEQSRHFARKRVNLENNYDPDAPYSQSIRLQARALAYANLSAAYYKLANLLVETSEQKTVFGFGSGSDE